MSEADRRRSGRSMRRLLPLAALIPPLVLAGAMAVRALHVDQVFGRVTRCEGCYLWLVVKHDLVFLAATVALMGAALWVRRSVARLALTAAAGACVVVYLLDVVVLLGFGTRLRLVDVLRFGGQFDAVATYILESLPTPGGLAALAGVALLVGGLGTAAAGSWTLSRRGLGVALASALVGVPLSFAPDGSSYIHAWAYRNLIELSRKHGRDQDYSDAFKARMLARTDPSDQRDLCQAGRDTRANVIVVLFESLSAYHSQRFSGLNDWTPELDAIAARHQDWSQMIANGFTTHHGLISVIAGHDPIPSVAYHQNLDERWGFPDLSESLPNRLKRHGYHTAFLTPGNLSFIDKGLWLEEAGFDEIEGHEHPSYEGEPRYHFKAAPDEALYRRALKWMDDNGRREPWLLVLQTVSSHQPFIAPYTRERSEAAAIRYADEALGAFYDQLRERAMLDDHVLVIASDHRAMTPVTVAQYERFGPAARAVVPLVVAGGPEVARAHQDRYVQQTDIAPSLEWVVGERACFDERESNLFVRGPAREPRCVLHYRGDMRDRIDAFCGERHAVIELDADRTSVLAGEPPRADALVAEINRERIERGPDRP